MVMDFLCSSLLKYGCILHDEINYSMQVNTMRDVSLYIKKNTKQYKLLFHANLCCG